MEGPPSWMERKHTMEGPPSWMEQALPNRLNKRTLVFYALGTAAAWTSMPAALTEFRAQAATRIPADLRGKNQFRIGVRITGTAGSTNSVIGVQYSTNGGTNWSWLDGQASPQAGVNAAALNVVNSTATTAWTNLVAAAKADVQLRVVGQSGDGVVSPTLGNIVLEIR